MERKEFERPSRSDKNRESISRTMEQLDEEKKKEIQSAKNRYVPHSSLILRLKELEKKHYIITKLSKRKSKRQLSIPICAITDFGFYELLRLTDGKYYQDIFDQFRNYPSFLIGGKLNELQDLFTSEQLFETFVEVCKNVDIVYVSNIKRNNVVRITARVLEYLDRGKRVDQFHFSAKIPQINNVVLMEESFFIYAESRSRSELKLKLYDAKSKIHQLIAFLFYCELLMRCLRANDEKLLDYPGRRQMPRILQLIQNDVVLEKIFIANLKKLEEINQKELATINELKSEIMPI